MTILGDPIYYSSFVIVVSNDSATKNLVVFISSTSTLYLDKQININTNSNKRLTGVYKSWRRAEKIDREKVRGNRRGSGALFARRERPEWAARPQALLCDTYITSLLLTLCLSWDDLE